MLRSRSGYGYCVTHHEFSAFARSPNSCNLQHACARSAVAFSCPPKGCKGLLGVRECQHLRCIGLDCKLTVRSRFSMAPNHFKIQSRMPDKKGQLKYVNFSAVSLLTNTAGNSVKSLGELSPDGTRLNGKDRRLFFWHTRPQQ